ncbi:MAG TPA: adenylyl-sulfate kinase [Actinomycetota bacterium]|nr:adenylyl-sulfate kinase [Actinomycetota bacterium]
MSTHEAVAVRADRGVVIWLTGLPSAGKSTVAEAVAVALKARGERVELLDGDLVRENLSKGLGFSKEDRDINIRRIGFVAELLARNGVKVITAAISPYRSVRDEVRAHVGEHFLEVYISTPQEVCEARDVKGLYAKARSGALTGFTGIDDPYEPPLAPEIEIQTQGETVDASAARVIDVLLNRGYLD